MDPVSLRPVRPRGIFRANHTRDGVARSREGQTYVLLNELPGLAGEDDIVEIMFEDGVWILASRDDLDSLE